MNFENKKEAWAIEAIGNSTHIAFSDDSECSHYKSLSLVTIPRQYFGDLCTEMRMILENFGITSEFKWHNIRDGRHHSVARETIEFVFRNRRKMRVDTIIWNLHDPRHKIRGRDDSKNLSRMYYHLFTTTASKRWNIGGVSWQWVPDNQSSIDWEDLRGYINSKKYSPTFNVFQDDSPSYELLSLEEICPSSSKAHPFIQIADLFAGIAAFSYGEYLSIKNWKVIGDTSRQPSLEGDFGKFSVTQKVRIPLILDLHRKCKDNKLNISLDSKKGLFSYKPQHFLNFWLYQRQSKHDKAPTRKEVWPIDEDIPF